MPALAECCERFLAYLENERRLSPRTVDTYRSGLKCFADFLKERHGIADAESITNRHIRLFVAEQNTLGKKPSSIDTWLSSVKSLFRFLVIKKLVTDNPALAVGGLKIPKRVPSFFREDQMNFLLDQPADEGTALTPEDDAFVSARDKAMLELLYSSGLRVSELTGLDLDRYYPDDLTVRVLGKGGKERIVPVGEAAACAIAEYLPLRSGYASSGENALFVSRQGGRITRRNVAMRLKNSVSTHSIGEKIHPHKLRHSFATAMVSNSHDVRAVQEMLGHGKLSTTQHYTHMDMNTLVQVYRSAHPRDSMGVGS